MTKIKMSKRQMMVEAHKMARKMVGDYSARLALALRTLWAAAKKGVKAVKTPLTSLNATVGARISATTKAFNVLYEDATITEVIQGVKNGNVTVKFVTDAGRNHKLIARTVAEKNFQGVFQAFLA